MAESEWRAQLVEDFGGSDDAEGNTTALSMLTAQVAALSRQVATLSEQLQTGGGGGAK
jgi:hypothetical protein